MPLVEVVGGATREDKTGLIRLAPADDGSPREIVVGGEAVEVSGAELVALASSFEVRVIENAGASSPLAASPFDSTASSAASTGSSSASTGGN